MNPLPDLPELDSVRASNWGPDSYRSAALVNALFASLPTLLACGSAAGALSLIIRGAPPALPFAGALFILSAAMLLWAAKIALGDFYWETDSHALTARGWFRDRLVQWWEVRSVTEGETRFGSYRKLATDRGSFRLPCESDTRIMHLHASVWQHLRRAGRAGVYDLPPLAATLWMPIPDGLPREIDWANPTPPNARLVWLKVAAIWCVSACAWYLANRDMGFRNAASNWIPIAVATFSITLPMLKSPLRTACRATVRRDGLAVALPGRSLDLSWRDVEDANWEDCSALVIWTGFWRAIRVPRGINDGSDELIVGIVRGLRERDDPLLLPVPSLAARLPDRPA